MGEYERQLVCVCVCARVCAGDTGRSRRTIVLILVRISCGTPATPRFLVVVRILST